jgi:hypothetical protein
MPDDTPAPKPDFPNEFTGFKFPSLPIVTPDPPPAARRSVAERYGTLFYLGLGGLVLLILMVAWFGWSAWNARSIWINVYVLHDESRPEAERIEAAYRLSHDPRVNQRQLWDIALRKPLPPLARYLVAEALTAEAAVADPHAYGTAVARSEGWPDWLRLMLLRPIAYAAAMGLTVDRLALQELSRNADPCIGLWATAAQALGPEGDADARESLKKAAGVEGPTRELAAILRDAAECRNEQERVAKLDQATLWLRIGQPEIARLWAGWTEKAGRILPR